MHGDELRAAIARVLFLLFSLSSFLFAMHAILRTTALLSHGVRADARVINLNLGEYHPEIVFRTAEGQVISYPRGGFFERFHQGDRLTILYNPKHPARTATVDQIAALWAGSACYLVLGLAFLLFGLGTTKNRSARSIFFFRGR